MALRALVMLIAILAAGAATACSDDDEFTEAGSTVSNGGTSTTEAEAAVATEGGPAAAADGRAGDRGAAGGGGNGGASAAAAGVDQRPRSIEDVITAVLTGAGEPVTICDEIVTERFVRIAYGAREGCIAAQQPGALARSVEVEEVGKRGNRVSAVVVPTGGPYDGIDIEVELIADPASPGAWLLDSLLADVPAGP